MHSEQHVDRAEQQLVDRAEQQLRQTVGDLVADAAASGDVRDDVAPEELASYCLHALMAASGLPAETALRRLVALTLAGMRSRAPLSPA